MSDRIFAIIILLLSAFLAWGASLTHESFIQDPVGPKIFPYILAGLGAISGLFILVRPTSNPVWPQGKQFFAMLAALLVLCAYSFLLPILGFVVVTVFASSYFSWVFGARPTAALLFGVVIALGLFVVFRLILGLSLASGPWGF